METYESRSLSLNGRFVVRDDKGTVLGQLSVLQRNLNNINLLTKFYEYEKNKNFIGGKYASLRRTGFCH